ncbi:hypothetical protein [uncultured Thiodictyon sp.]|jgi:hypothetical protein|uniref:hypothetical protein n=1 Tax=uncultured Thiodictyon sp. TaxID=1846217 RepID=UPI0025E19F93|nr:hypothetical protein [uncultured Thiodictyon sp.]
MQQLDLLAARLADHGVGPGGDTRGSHDPRQAALESHLDALRERLGDLERSGAAATAGADTRLQLARTLVGLDRGAEAWPLGRAAFNDFLAVDDFESAADACDVLFQAGQPDSICALGQGIWLAVTCPVDPELSIDLLRHVIDETPDDADGAAVAASTALFLADVRAQGKHRDDLMFFSTQTLGNVARRHSGVQTPEQFDRWMERLELKEPDKFLMRLRSVVEVLVRDDWWFDRDALRDRLPFAADQWS